jgi:hypothetical protein
MFCLVKVLGKIIGVRENDCPHIEWIITEHGVVEVHICKP